MKDMRIVFMGTPDFAAAILKRLIDTGRNVVGVFSQPDKPVGRKQIIMPTAVKALAMEHNIPVYQPAKLRDGTALEIMKELAPDLVVVAAYGKILPKDLLDVPPLGNVNVHGSLLPKYRGSAPIQWSVINGDKITGITTMYMAEGLDTGDILEMLRTPIGENDNFEDIHDRLGVAGADALTETLKRLRDGTLTATVQDESLATYAAKIEKADCLLDFSVCAKALHDRIRGLSPFPLSFTRTPDGKMLKVVESRVSQKSAPVDAKPGTVLALSDTITVACGEGTALELLRVLPEGKGRMSAADYIRGRRLQLGDILG